MMNDRDFWYLGALIGMLSLASILHSKVLGKMIDDVRDLRTDIDWLKDNTVATEART